MAKNALFEENIFKHSYVGKTFLGSVREQFSLKRLLVSLKKAFYFLAIIESFSRQYVFLSSLIFYFMKIFILN